MEILLTDADGKPFAVTGYEAGKKATTDGKYRGSFATIFNERSMAEKESWHVLKRSSDRSNVQGTGTIGRRNSFRARYSLGLIDSM